MDDRVLAALTRLRAGRLAFALATVVGVRGSASAAVGSRAVIDAEGVNVAGWVGGGCAEAFVVDHALRAMRSGEPIQVEVDLDDEILGVGMPCGGVMDVLIEPLSPAPRLLVAARGPLATALATTATELGWTARVHSSDPVEDVAGVAQTVGPWRDVRAEAGEMVVVATRHDGDDAVVGAALDANAAEVALVCRRSRGDALLRRLGLPPGAVSYPAGLDLGGAGPAALALSVIAGLQAARTGSPGGARTRSDAWTASISSALTSPRLVIVGRTRITEALARLAMPLGWPVIVDGVGAPPGTAFPAGVEWRDFGVDFAELPADERTLLVVAAHHKGDHEAIAVALRRDVPYIGLVASAKRTELIRSSVGATGASAAALERLRGPAGLLTGGRRPADVALSLLAEVAAVAAGRTGLPLASLPEPVSTESPGCS